MKLSKNRFETMHKMHGYNPWRCNSASTLSGYIERDTSKVIIALPANNDAVDIFEKTLTRGFSCINTRLGFDAEILMPNYSCAEFNKMTIDQSFKSYKRQGLKIGYMLKLDGEKTYIDRRRISKILKLDEKIQYGFAVNKPLSVGCIKEHKKIPAGQKFKRLYLDDKIGHLFVVDIKFNKKEEKPNQYMYSEIYCPIFGKKKNTRRNRKICFLA